MCKVNDGRPATIYGLIDPRDGQLRYVGKTVRSLKDRIREHKHDPTRNHRTNWLKSVYSYGAAPEIVVLEVTTQDEGSAAEIWWIAYMKFIGCKLVNATLGGEGVIPTTDTRHKMSIAQKRRVRVSKNTKKVSLKDLGYTYIRKTCGGEGLWITDTDILFVRGFKEEFKYTFAELVDIFKLSDSVLRNIITGRTGKHIPVIYKPNPTGRRKQSQDSKRYRNRKIKWVKEFGDNPWCYII